MEEFIQQLINGLSLGSIYALIAVGYTMVYGVLQLINFAHGDVFMVGAMVALYAVTGRLPPTLPWWLHAIIIGGILAAAVVMLVLRRSWRAILSTLLPFVILYVVLVPTMLVASRTSDRVPQTGWSTTVFMFLVSILTCGLIGFLIERLAYRPLRDRPRINSLITAIGISLLLEFGGQHRGVFGPTPQPFPADVVPGIKASLGSIGGVVISRVDLLIILVTLLLMLALTWIVLKTKTGLALRAVSFRFDTAALMGININRIISFTFILGSVLAACAGLLYAIKYPKVEPLMGLLPGVKAFIAAVFGGIGNIAGAVLGGIIMGMVEVLVVGYLPHGSQYRDGVAFVILIVILLVKPSGLLGKHAVEKV
jgi:branched-chain amino acid transport system permease protein